jgi:hypothetical protein
MVDDGDSNSSPPDVSHASSPSSAIQSALTRFFDEAYPAFDNLMSVLSTSGFIIDPTIKTLFFNGVGGYLFALRSAHLQGFDFPISHHMATGFLMQDDAISRLVDQSLAMMVDRRIERVVE